MMMMEIVVLFCAFIVVVANVGENSD
jgi:hypothetical protein